ncbi:MAG: SPFH domain-containing protein, partial [Planctomycetota bacterium]
MPLSLHVTRAAVAKVIFVVNQQEVAVRLRFGKITGGEAGQVYGPGLHIGLPTPIEEVIRIPIAPQTTNINQAFWYEVTEADAGKTA